MLVTKQLPVAIDFHIIFLHTMEVNGYRQLFGYQQFFKVSLCSTEESMRVWNSLRVSKWWQNFRLWENYPFKKMYWP